jgi:hypothetical protein
VWSVHRRCRWSAAVVRWAEAREGVTAWAPGAVALSPEDGDGVAAADRTGGNAGCGRASTVTSAWPPWCNAAGRWGSGPAARPGRYARAACTPRSSDARARHRIPPGPDRGDARARAGCTSGARATSSSGSCGPATPESFLRYGAVSVPRLPNVSCANEIGEPDGEPTLAGVRPHQATTSHGFPS